MVQGRASGPRGTSNPATPGKRVLEINTDTSPGGPPISVWALLVAAYLLPLTWVASLFVGTGRTPYDRASGTTVINRRSAVEP